MTKLFTQAITPGLFVAAAMALSACSETTGEGGGASMQPPGSMQSSSAMRTGSAQDEQACMSAVAAQANNSVTVLSSDFSEANTLVMVGVGPQRAPWRCLVSRGRVAEVSFAGTEGGSVAQQAPSSSNVPSDLTNFVGARGGQAEGGLANLGYELARTQGLTAFWWNAGSRTCARIVTADGRYQSINTVASADCGK